MCLWTEISDRNEHLIICHISFVSLSSWQSSSSGKAWKQETFIPGILAFVQTPTEGILLFHFMWFHCRALQFLIRSPHLNSKYCILKVQNNLTFDKIHNWLQLPISTRLTFAGAETYKCQQMTCQGKKKPQNKTKTNTTISSTLQCSKVLSKNGWTQIWPKKENKTPAVMKIYSCSCRVEMFVNSDPGERRGRQRKQVVIIQC